MTLCHILPERRGWVNRIFKGCMRTIARYGYVWNGHIMFIYIYIYNIEHRKSRNTKNTYDFLVQVRNFFFYLLLPLSLKVLRHKERDTHSFYSDFFICPHLVRHLPKATGFGKQAKANRLLSRQDSTNWLIQNPKILRALLVRDVIRTRQTRFPSELLWHLWVTRPLHPRARVNTCINVAPQYPMH